MSKFKDRMLLSEGFIDPGFIWDCVMALQKYARDSNPKTIFPKFNKLLGTGELFNKTKSYILYTGLYVRKDEELNDDHIGISWTTSLSQARKFARGSKHHFDAPKNDSNYVGYVLEFHPKPEHILADYDYVEERFEDDDLNFPFSEHEVIVKTPKNIKGLAKIKEVLNF